MSHHSNSPLAELLKTHPTWRELNSYLLNDCNYYLDMETHMVYEYNNVTRDIRQTSEDKRAHLYICNKLWMT